MDEPFEEYLMNEYGEEEFLYELEEQDLYEYACKLLQAYKSNLLDVTLRSQEEILRKKYEFLKSEYADLFSDFHAATQQLKENGLFNDTDFCDK